MIHTALLLGPDFIVLAPVETPLPPLTARLEPLPAVKTVPHPIRKHLSKLKARAHTAQKPVTPPAVETVQPDADRAEIASAASQPEAAPTMDDVKPPRKTGDTDEMGTPSYPLPKHAQLTFVAYLGTSYPVGEVRHRLDIDENSHYSLQVSMATTGFVSLFKTFGMNQQSSGTISAQGLRPDEFSEVKITSDGKQTSSAKFDWQNNQVAFSNGNESALPGQTQDILSFLYQFSQVQLEQSTLPMHVSNGRKLESYQFEVGAEEEIQTRLGKLRTLHLVKIHAPGEEGLEIWLGLEYRLLPVKIRQIDRKGETGGELVISEIRVSEE
jgi:hypothetical protein